MGSMESLLSAILFAIPVTATSWRGLGWRAVIAAGLTLVAFGAVTEWRFSLQVEGGDANIGAGILIYYAVSIFGGGFAARILSLWARALGHPRPWSLWIEGAFFFGFPYLLRTWLGG